jgi:hypothetical protein
VKSTTEPIKPDFLILGAQKCGTTSLAQALAAHPDVFIPEAKEAHHYGSVADESVGGDSLRRFFKDRKGERVIGEATPEYLYKVECQRQITANLPEVKAIVILRNPIDRAYSAYIHGVRAGIFRSSFEAALADEPRLVARGQRGFGPVVGKGFHPLVGKGFYATQLRRYLDGGLDRSRLNVVLLDDLEAEPAATLESVQGFIGVDAVPTKVPVVNQARASVYPASLRRVLYSMRSRSDFARRALESSYRTSAPSAMDPETRARLIDVFVEPNDDLSKLIDRDLSAWNR